MKIYNNPVSKWWLDLDPTHQYIYWIITFCVMLSVGIGLIVCAVEYGYAATALIPILGSIGVFFTFFMFVVLWLTIRWPDIRD